MKTIRFDRPRDFALRAASDFYAGFVPGSGMAVAAADHLTLAFRLDKTFEAVAVALREEGGSLVAEFEGTDDGVGLSKQLARMLGLDVDACAWIGLGRANALVGKLQAEFPGFFTAAKPSPYDAAVWGIISPRMRIGAAAKLKIEIARTHGDEVTLLGRTHRVFPSPKQLLDIATFPGLPEVKLARLHTIARAALACKLDVDRLRAMSVHDAMEELKTLPGVGPWTASHILFRGAALADGLPLAEPRVLHGLADVSGIDVPSPAAFHRMAEGWRPFRMWVSILLARHLARAGGWSKPALSAERAAMGRRLKRDARWHHA